MKRSPILMHFALNKTMTNTESQFVSDLKAFSKTLGFQDCGITDTELPDAKQRLKEWLDLGYQGEMAYMARYGDQRADPAAIIPGTKRVIVVRMDYLPANPQFHTVLDNKNQGFISRYAQDRDYHKLIRKRLQKLADYILETHPHTQTRAFVDSGPIMEKPLAVKAGLGWMGKNTLLIHPQAGSFFFIGTLLTNLPLPTDPAFATQHCGSCSACMKICPTQAIVAPYVLDARRCISYLTIELKASIPLEFRKAIGNRIYGCDDCQFICPWNKFAQTAQEIGFHSKRGFLSPHLLDLFAWTEAEFLDHTEGSAIRRIGYECWQRNLAIALGNAPASPEIIAALQEKLSQSSALVQEHILWALDQLQTQSNDSLSSPAIF